MATTLDETIEAWDAHYDDLWKVLELKEALAKAEARFQQSLIIAETVEGQYWAGRDGSDA